MPFYYFYHDRKDFYRVQADSKEQALAYLDKAEENDTLESYYDWSEENTDWVFYGKKQGLPGEWVKDDA